jgi:hypothetical protein
VYRIDGIEEEKGKFCETRVYLNSCNPILQVTYNRFNQNFEVRMSNSCGPEENRVHLWTLENEIRDKRAWRMGWVTLEEIRMADKGPLIDAKVCFRCKGERVLNCIECDGKGKTGYHQQLYGKDQ